jgi:Domain of unknown function (DUF4157)
MQTKLKISEPGDMYEQEADRIAEQVMSASPNSVVNSAPPRIQRFTEQTAGQADMVAPASVDSVLSSPGSPLEPGLQQDMGQRFGHDFSRVRVHTDAAAARSAQDVNATAYTVGNNIVFGANSFMPETRNGLKLLAHELTHVIQQGNEIRRYRNKGAFNFGKQDDATLIEDSFDVKKDKETKPWIEQITVEFTSLKSDSKDNIYSSGTVSVQYYDNPVKLSDFSFAASGGSQTLGKSTSGTFTVHRIEGIGYNSGTASGPFDPAKREGPNKRYSKNLLANMSYAVFYNQGEALHAGPLNFSSHGCVHVDWEDYATIKQLNYHSVIGLTKVKVKYVDIGDFPMPDPDWGYA